MARNICTEPDCEKVAHARGLCDMHRSRLQRYGSTAAPLRGTVGWLTRFIRVGDVHPVLGTPCWVWTGYLNEYGYGRTRIKGQKDTLVHRIVYTTVVGPIPDGLVIDHLCRNTSCCNPAHLEPVTDAVNVMRGEGMGVQNARKTHCLRGHAFDEANTHYKPNGGRECRACGNAAKRESARRRRAA